MLEAYVLLANQLHQFEATEAVVDACLSIVHNRAIVLEECPEIPSHLQVWVSVSTSLTLRRWGFDSERCPFKVFIWGYLVHVY